MTTWTDELLEPIDYLTLESSTSDFLLLEQGGQLILEQTGNDTTVWTEETY